MASFISRSVEETIAFARARAAALQPNDVVALCGDLGAGKTHFVKGLVAGCGSDEPVTSPTFTLLHEYRGGRLPVFHFDFYRIAQRAEIEQLGFDELLNEGGVAVIEWADRFPELLPSRTRWIWISATSEGERFVAENE
ncbi:MAG: tRNA (adenosine(37)-N6)-threonylcarbamoyltransferase complex ATPase subunit type 1 TsaE [Chthoniobacterales bacterium]|nr:tRNA (adenosine(37)-N6)-threonylcarbamoyltransferase complex ATPase subunit type 1 TsaE [Chthoniobacterales bacterium]